MRVDVHYFGNFRYIADREGQTIELSSNACVRDLLNLLTIQYNRMAKFLSLNNINKSHVLIVKGEKPVFDYNKTQLTEGDQIYLFIMLAGG